MGSVLFKIRFSARRETVTEVTWNRFEVVKIDMRRPTGSLVGCLILTLSNL